MNPLDLGIAYDFSLGSIMTWPPSHARRFDSLAFVRSLSMSSFSIKTAAGNSASSSARRATRHAQDAEPLCRGLGDLTEPLVRSHKRTALASAVIARINTFLAPMRLGAAGIRINARHAPDHRFGQNVCAPPERYRALRRLFRQAAQLLQRPHFSLVCLIDQDQLASALSP